MADKKKNARIVRRGFIWLVKPTIWRNKWNIDKELHSDSPAGMQLSDLKRNHESMRRAMWEENALKKELIKKLDDLSPEEAFAFYVREERLSNPYLEHRRKSLKTKGFIAYLLCFIMVAVSLSMPVASGVTTFIGKFIPFVLSVAFFAHAINSFYRAEQIKQRRMFHFFEMFNQPLKLFM